MTLQLGYAISTVIFFTVLIVTAVAQRHTKSFHPLLYWTVIVACIRFTPHKPGGHPGQQEQRA